MLSAVVVAWLVMGALVLLALAFLWFSPPPGPGSCAEGRLVCGVPMTATTGGNCNAGAARENTFNVSVGGLPGSLTTSSFAFSLTEAGTSQSTPPAAATTASSGSCYASPAAGGWYVVLIPPGASGTNWAIFSGSGWQQCTGAPTAPCTSLAPLPTPVTVAGGQTLLLVASPAVDLVQATLGVYGTNGNQVTGTVTL